MKYGLTIKDMQVARDMLKHKNNHDFAMDILRDVYQMRVKSGGIESEVFPIVSQDETLADGFVNRCVIFKGLQ